MQLLYWTSNERGKLAGTINTQDGHVLLKEIEPDDKPLFDDLIRRFADSCDSLPTTSAKVIAFLDSEGIPRYDNPELYSGHTAYTSKAGAFAKKPKARKASTKK